MSRNAHSSPSVSATLYHPNGMKKGNDGNMCQAVADKNGVFGWRRKTLKMRYYQTQCNDPSQEYLVGFSKSIVSVWRRREETMDEFSTDEEYRERKYFDELVWQLKNPIKVMPGKSPRNSMTAFSGGYGPKSDGNTLLVQASPRRYMFIGCGGVYGFTLGANEKIKNYMSPVGNSSVPYPYLETNKFMYLLPGSSKVAIEEYRSKTDNHPEIEGPYDALWHHKELKIKELPFVMKNLT